MGTDEILKTPESLLKRGRSQSPNCNCPSREYFSLEAARQMGGSEKLSLSRGFFSGSRVRFGRDRITSNKEGAICEGRPSEFTAPQ